MEYAFLFVPKELQRFGRATPQTE